MSDDLDEYIEMRQELEVMTHAELVEEVINRMKFQQQIVIDRTYALSFIDSLW